MSDLKNLSHNTSLHLILQYLELYHCNIVIHNSIRLTFEFETFGG
jgi:hypothetical protein